MGGEITISVFKKSVLKTNDNFRICEYLTIVKSVFQFHLITHLLKVFFDLFFEFTCLSLKPTSTQDVLILMYIMLIDRVNACYYV